MQTYGAQGVTPDGLQQTMDLGVRVGSMDQLRADTVAVSELAARTMGVNVGERIRLRLGDGTPITPRVVATYERGLGFGDFTFPDDTIQGHVADPLANAVLVRLADRADPDEVDAALARLTRRYRGLGVLDRAGFQAAQTQEQALNTWVNLLMAGVLLGYIAVSAANSLVMGTSQRARELALLRLVGTTRRQVLQARSACRLDLRVVAAILDRLLHHGTVLTINGPSYRMRRHHQRVEQLRAGLQAAEATKQ